MILRSAIACLLVLFEIGAHSHPISFQQNKGQAPADVRYLFRTSGYQLDFKRAEMVLHVQDKSLRFRFDGPIRKRNPEGHARLDGLIRYIDALDEKQHDGVPAFASVRYDSLYTGIDLVFYGRRSRLESSILVAPQADVQQIVFFIEGADRIELNDDGDLLIDIAGTRHEFRRPPAAQVVGSTKKPVGLRFQLTNPNEIRFEVGEYDHSLPLIIG